MALNVEIQGLDEVRELLAKLPSNVFQVAKTAFNTTAIKVQSTVINGSFGLGSNQLRSRTGTLARSIKIRTGGTDLKTLFAGVGSDVLYAPIQETGTLDNPIRAKNKYLGVPGGPYLNIPLPDNQTPAGVMRYSAREVFAMGGYIYRSQKGNWIVGLGGLNMFVLRKESKIPPRLGLGKAGEKQVPVLLSDLKQALLQGLQ